MFVSALAAVAAVAPGEEGADPLVLRDPIMILFTVPGLAQTWQKLRQLFFLAAQLIHSLLESLQTVPS